MKDDLDLFVSTLGNATGLAATRDPNEVDPPCLYVDAPTVEWFTMAGATVTVPVYLLVPGPNDRRSLDTLLGLLPTVMSVCCSDNAAPVQLALGDFTYPAYKIVRTLTVNL
jgi:hypothetical protein